MKHGIFSLFSVQVLVVGLIWASMMAPHAAVAHGEDKPGPNGGEIRMPGAFHVEVKGKSREFEVFLIDLEFRNPVVENSSVEMRIVPAKAGAKEQALVCRTSKAARPSRFVCVSSKYQPIDGDTLKVKAKRETSTGSEVDYKLPLLTAKSGVEEKPASSHDPHHGHGH